MNETRKKLRECAALLVLVNLAIPIPLLGHSWQLYAATVIAGYGLGGTLFAALDAMLVSEKFRATLVLMWIPVLASERVCRWIMEEK